MALPQWSQSGANQYNYAINGIPFLAATNKDMPYVRGTAQVSKNQIDTTPEIGEQSLQSWWYRSQSTFDFGAGSRFFDTVRDKNLSRRFFDSHGIDALTTVGETILQRKATTVAADSTAKQYTVGYSNAGENGVLHAYGSTLKKVTAAGAVSTVLWGGSGTILNVITNGSSYFVLSTEGIYSGSLPAGVGSRLYRTSTTSGNIAWAKERLIVCLDDTVFTLAAGTQASYTTSNISGNGTQITYTFTAIHGWEVGQVVTVTGASIAGYNVTDASITEVSTDGLTFKIAGTATGTNTTLSTVTFLPTPIYKTNITGWTWSSIADGPNAIYLSGYVGDKSYIYRSTYNAKTLNMDVPSIVAELPHGEIVYTVVTYMGTFILVGTNIGLRVGVIASDGSLTLGPLSIETNNNVKSVIPRGNFAWVSGANSDGKTAIYRIDLSKQVADNTLQFAWQKDLHVDGSTFNLNNEVLSITSIGMTGRVAFTVANVGLVFESATERVDTGWLETGKIRYDTAEDKIFQYMKVTNLTADGKIAVHYRDETNTLSALPLYEWNTDDIRAVNIEASDGEPHPWVSYRFILSRGNTAGTGVNSTPVLLSYQVKSQPSYVKQRLIEINLMCFEQEATITGKMINRNVFERIQNLELCQEKGNVIIFQDFNTGEQRLAIIEGLEFTSRSVGATRGAQANPGGILKIVLRTVDNVGVNA